MSNKSNNKPKTFVDDLSDLERKHDEYLSNESEDKINQQNLLGRIAERCRYVNSILFGVKCAE